MIDKKNRKSGVSVKAAVTSSLDSNTAKHKDSKSKNDDGAPERSITGPKHIVTSLGSIEIVIVSTKVGSLLSITQEIKSDLLYAFEAYPRTPADITNTPQEAAASCRAPMCRTRGSAGHYPVSCCRV